MHRILILSRTLLAIGGLILARAQSAEPILVFVDPKEDDRTQVYVNSVARFECLDQLEPIQTLLFENNSYYQIRNPEDFDGRTGLVYFLDSNQLKSSRFWTVSGPEVFHDFLEFLTDARGSGAKVDGDKFRKKITVRPTKPQPGKPHLTWHDLYVTYDEGVIYLGDSEVWGLKGAARLSTVVKQSKGKDSYFWASTKHVPKAARNMFMSALGIQAGVQMQRRDNEEESTFASRRALYVGYLKAMRSIVFDFDEIRAWTVLPRVDKPFRAHLSFKASPNSQLAQKLRKIRVASNVKDATSELPIGTAKACFLIPDEFRPLCEQYLSQFPGDREPAKSLIRSVLRQGKVDARASVGVTKQNVPVIQAAVQVPESTNLNDVARQGGTHLDLERGVHIARKTPQFFRFLSDVSLKQLAALFIWQCPAQKLRRSD